MMNLYLWALVSLEGHIKAIFVLVILYILCRFICKDKLVLTDWILRKLWLFSYIC